MNPVRLPLSESDLERFSRNLPSRPAEPDACWEWQCGRTATGGRFWLQGETRYSHIVAWLIANGEIPNGLQVLHTCQNPYCCRVSHMKLGHAMRTTHENLKDRFLAKTSTGSKRPHMNSSCLEWTGSHGPGGYGVVVFSGRQKKAHHVAWFLEHGVWPQPPKVVMHRCDNRKCVKIEHLQLGTRVENRLDCVRKGRQAKGQTHGSQTKPESVPKGEASGRAKITTAKVIQIRLTIRTHPDVHGVLEGLARKFKLDASTVRAIADGSLWGHVEVNSIPGLKPIPLSGLVFGHKRGEESPFSKVSDATIRMIRDEYDKAGKKWGMISKLAKEFQLSPSHVHRIVHGTAR